MSDISNFSCATCPHCTLQRQEPVLVAEAYDVALVSVEFDSRVALHAEFRAMNGSYSNTELYAVTGSAPLS